MNDEDSVLMFFCLGGSLPRSAPLGVLEDPAGPLPGIQCLAALRDGALLAAGFADGSLRLWDTLSRACVGALRGGHEAGRAVGPVAPWHAHAVGALAEMPGGRLASGSFDGTICVWELGWV
jgi:WD40 repeat protein